MHKSQWVSVADTYARMFKLVKSERFLKMQSLGNEVPFYICPHPVSESVGVAEMRKQLVNSLSKQGVRVLEVDLYDLAIELLKKDDDLEYYLKEEESLSKDKLKEDLQSILDVKSVLVPAIAQKMESEEFDVLFLSGVGEVFPYIRSHNVLNNLQSTAKSRPTVMFFPGSYTHSLEKGASLDLFGELHDDKYYRAFNVFNCEA